MRCVPMVGNPCSHGTEMIHLTAHKPSHVLPTGKLIFEGSTKDLQSMVQKLKIARNWDLETKQLLDEEELSHALDILLK